MSDHLEAIRHYCAYQERSHQETRYKLMELGFYGDALEEALSDLIAEGFLNEERFARSYVSGKFRIKKWGKQKIIRHLKQKQVSPFCIQSGLAEIDEDEYRQTLRDLFDKKAATLRSEKNIWIKKQKILRYLAGKGYETPLIYEYLNRL